MIALVLAAAISLQPCTVQETEARCGTLSVPENPARPAARSLSLNVVVVPAKERHDDAVFILAGGPGVAATNMTSFAVETFAAAGRDIVLVDARGTGRSNPLRCPVGESMQEVFDDLLPAARVESCRDALGASADLTQYTTGHVAADLEKVRAALGYRRVSLYGTSYGTRVAQEYMRRYPRSVRAVILDGVVPPSFGMPARYAEKAERSLTRVLDLCAADASCAMAFPSLMADYAAALADAEDGIELTIVDPKTKVESEVKLGRGLFGEIMRNFLYSPAMYSQLPFVVHAAAGGDWAPFAQMAQRYSRGVRGLDLGFLLSVTCAEDLPRVDERAVRAAAAGTLLGAYRLDQQLRACSIWPRGASNPALAKPVHSSIPTLIVSGELDPVTPPEYGDEVARTLRRSRHVVIPLGSHSGDTGGCQERVMSEFVSKGSVDALDLSCVKTIKPSPFRLE